MNCCPNPKCRKPLKKIIPVNQQSKDTTKIEYACPHCKYKLDPAKTQLFKKEETLTEERTQTEKRQPKTERPPNCPKHFGYLINGLKDSIIPQECLFCARMLDCTRG
jgi:hypothetical protein